MNLAEQVFLALARIGTLIDTGAARAHRELEAMAKRSRRSIGQRARRIMEGLRK